MKIIPISVIAAAFLAATAAGVPTSASDWSDDEVKVVEQLSDWATKFAKQSETVSPFTRALGEFADKLKGSLTTLTDKTLIKPEWIDQLDADRQAINKAMPPVTPSLNGPGAYKRMVGDLTTPSTYQSGLDELRTLDKVGRDRAATIAGLKRNRDGLKLIAERYNRDAALSHKVGDAYRAILKEHPMIDTAFVFAGVNGYFSLTVLAWEAEVEPAFDERAGAAAQAVARFDTAIKAAEDDLKTFNSLKSALRRMYGFDAAVLDTQNLNPATVDLNPGAVGRFLDQAMAANARAIALATKMQEQADEIANHNAGISKVQRFTGLMRAAGGVATASTEPESSPGTTINQTTNTQILFKVVPGEFFEQERRGQTPISPPSNLTPVKQKPQG